MTLIERLKAAITQFDFDVIDAEADAIEKDANIQAFTETVMDDLRRHLKTYALADERVTIDERGKTFYIYFQGERLFHVSVARRSTQNFDHLCIITDGEVVLTYKGEDDYARLKYDISEPMKTVKHGILLTFESALNQLAERKASQF